MEDANGGKSVLSQGQLRYPRTALGLASPVGDNYTLIFISLQVRGHAMFSDEGRTLDEETLEYAWLVEVQLGKLGGKMTAPQVKLLHGCVRQCHSVPGSLPSHYFTSFAANLLNPASRQHVAVLPVATAEMRKCVSALSLAKPRQNTEPVPPFSRQSMKENVLHNCNLGGLVS